MQNKPIYILFKTHLDIGFTDYAENIVDNYLRHFIPNAIRVGNELKDTDTPFVWTVGSWMLYRALQEDTTGVVDQAIRDGILHWHGLPFTSHTELENPTLFRYGLSLSGELDKRYGKTTIGAKMTDVPGHTKGMIPLMAEAGLQFLHIGINPATPLPPVPPLFRWRCEGREITVMYQGDYGQVAEFAEFGIYFAHTGDNLGPQSKEQIIAIYDSVKAKFPCCPVLPGTMDDLARLACRIPHLPILDGEIGDTWIHGAGTDPEKVSRYRRVLRHIEENGIPAGADLSDNLLLVPEHTWGMDVKTHFHNDTHFTQAEMESVKPAREKIEKSWQEQRDYVTKAEALLGLAPEYPVTKPDLTGYTPVEPADPGFRLCWQIFTNEDYRRYQRDYMRLTEANRGWALWDFTKVGLPEDAGGMFAAELVGSYEKDGVKLYKMTFPKEAAEQYGLPYFWAEVRDGGLTLKWFDKKPNRFPQACWCKLTGLDESWEIHKLGQWISPENVIGSPFITAIDHGVRNKDVEIRSLDAALAAPYGRRLLRYGEDRGPQDLWFNLYNNIWNTNFPMWYQDDGLFRFTWSHRETENF